jgi:hypothetical protein
MKRVIVEFKKLNDEIMNLLVDKFPYGYDDDDIITFKNTMGEQVEAVEVRTEDTIYLVKIGMKLQAAIKEFDDVEVEIDDQEIDTDDNISSDEDIDLDLD